MTKKISRTALFLPLIAASLLLSGCKTDLQHSREATVLTAIEQSRVLVEAMPDGDLKAIARYHLKQAEVWSVGAARGDRALELGLAEANYARRLAQGDIQPWWSQHPWLRVTDRIAAIKNLEHHGQLKNRDSVMQWLWSCEETIRDASTRNPDSFLPYIQNQLDQAEKAMK